MNQVSWLTSPARLVRVSGTGMGRSKYLERSNVADHLSLFRLCKAPRRVGLLPSTTICMPRHRAAPLAGPSSLLPWCGSFSSLYLIARLANASQTVPLQPRRLEASACDDTDPPPRLEKVAEIRYRLQIWLGGKPQLCHI